MKRVRDLLVGFVLLSLACAARGATVVIPKLTGVLDPTNIIASSDTTVPLSVSVKDFNQTADLLDLWSDVGVGAPPLTKAAWFDSSGNFFDAGNIGTPGNIATFGNPNITALGLHVIMMPGGSVDFTTDPALDGGIVSPTHLRLHAVTTNFRTVNQVATLEYYEDDTIGNSYPRWTIRKNDDPETGNNAGSNFDIHGEEDTGTGGYQGGPWIRQYPDFEIFRATGVVQMAYGLTTSNYGTYGPRTTQTSITVGASPYTYTNADNSMETVYIYGGTVSNESLTRNSTTTQIGAATGLSVVLSPGDAVQVTYSAAPTMVKAPF